MKLLVIGALTALSVSCTSNRFAAKHISEPLDNTHVIGLRTGSHGTTWYDDRFEAKAKEICNGDYQVVEKARKPEALKVAGDLLDKYDFYWVVECSKD